MVKCESLRINLFRITHTGKSVNFPVTQVRVRTVTTKETFFLFLDNLAFSRPTESFVLVIFEDLE